MNDDRGSGSNGDAVATTSGGVLSDDVPLAVYTFVQMTAVKCHLQYSTSARACMLLHRLARERRRLWQQSEVGGGKPADICLYTTAIACIYLAGKCEEDRVRIRQLLNIAHMTLHPTVGRPDQRLDERHYWRVREGIARLELYVARVLGFRVSPPAAAAHDEREENVYAVLNRFLYRLRNTNRDVFHDHPLASVALSVVNDMHLSPSFIEAHSAHMLSLCAIYTVAAVLRVQLVGTVPARSSDDVSDGEDEWRTKRKRRKRRSDSAASSSSDHYCMRSDRFGRDVPRQRYRNSSTSSAVSPSRAADRVASWTRHLHSTCTVHRLIDMQTQLLKCVYAHDNTAEDGMSPAKVRHPSMPAVVVDAATTLTPRQTNVEHPLVLLLRQKVIETKPHQPSREVIMKNESTEEECAVLSPDSGPTNRAHTNKREIIEIDSPKKRIVVDTSANNQCSSSIEVIHVADHHMPRDHRADSPTMARKASFDSNYARVRTNTNRVRDDEQPVNVSDADSDGGRERHRKHSGRGANKKRRSSDHQHHQRKYIRSTSSSECQVID